MIKKFTISEILFLTAYAVLLFKFSFGNTTFIELIDNKSLFWKGISLFSYSLILFKVIFSKEIGVRKLFVSLIILCCALITFCYTNLTEILTLAILLLGIENVNFKKVVITYFYVYGLVTIAAMLSAFFEVTEMYKIDSEIHGIRYALGNTYPTDFSAGIFYLLLAFVYLYKKWKLKYYVIWGAIITFTYIFTKARADFLLCIFVLISRACVKNNSCYILNKNFFCKCIKFLSIFVFPLLMFLSYFSVLLFNKGNPIISELNILMNYRIGYISNFLSEYNINLFGNKVLMTGAGWGTATEQDYNFLDNGYFFSLLIYGEIITTFFVIGFSLVAFKTSDFIINYIFVFIAVNALIEPRFISFEYNPFLFLIGLLIFNKRFLTTQNP